MEDSRALPHYFYGDPAIALERKQLMRIGCESCAKCRTVLRRVVCTDSRNAGQLGVPHIGQRCKFYTERG